MYLGAGGEGGSAHYAHGKTSLSWKPNLESVGAVEGVGGGAWPSSLASGGGTRFSSQPTSGVSLEPPKTSHRVASKRVTRKVQKFPTTAADGMPSSLGTRTGWGPSASSSQPSAPAASSLITTSSWRAGKELTDRILKGSGDRERDQTHDYRTRSERWREETSPRHSIASESHSQLSSSQENISTVSSSFDLNVHPERGQLDVNEPFVGVGREGHSRDSPRYDDGTKTKSEGDRGGGSGGSGGGMALDMAGLLEDLEESPVPAGGAGDARSEERAKLVRTRSASGGPTSKRPRYNIPVPGE